MNKNLMTEAISFLDMDIIENYYQYKDKLEQKKRSKAVFLKWTAVSACFWFVVILAVHLSIAFTGSEGTYPHGKGDTYTSTIGEVSELYGEGWLVANCDGYLNDTLMARLYYDVGGDIANPDDWYSVIIGKNSSDCFFTIYSFFDEEQDLEDRKIDSVFTKKATKTEVMGDITVYYAEAEKSYFYEHKIYAIFEYSDVIYDIRVESDDPQIIKRIVEDMLEELN